MLTVVFIAAEALMFYWKGGYAMTLVPLALLVVWLFVVRLETGLLTMALLTPFAINTALLPGMELSMPVEPMMILFTFFFFSIIYFPFSANKAGDQILIPLSSNIHKTTRIIKPKTKVRLIPFKRLPAFPPSFTSGCLLSP